MDRDALQRELLVERYVSGRLSEAETESFEAYLVEHPEVVDEVEAAEGIRAGLRELRRIGQLPRLLQVGDRQPWLLRYAVAASIVAAASLGVLGYDLLAGHLSRDNPYASISTATVAIRLEGSRSVEGSDAFVVELPSTPATIELRTDVTLVEAASYSVQIDRVTKEGRTPVLDVEGMRPDDSGDLVLRLHSAALPNGDYLWIIAAIAPDDRHADAGTVAFSVRRDQR
jgi:hypothetical protein